MTRHFIYLDSNILPRNKLLQCIYIKNLPLSMSFLGLELNGQIYFRLDREALEKCYKNNTNLFEHWGFNEALPIQGKIIIESDEEFDNSNLIFSTVNDTNNMWEIITSGTYDYNFYDTRIEQNNYLRVRNCAYGIEYNV